MATTRKFEESTGVTQPPAEPPVRQSPSRRLLRVALLIVIAGSTLLAWTWWWGRRMPDGDLPPLGVLATVPDFTLIERDGRKISRRDLLGTVWIADFIFTRCAGPCPELSLRMRSLQRSILTYKGDVKLVSFSVDPQYDQPPVLRAYALRYGAHPALWWFLTCNDEMTMYDLVQKGFLQALAPSKGGSPIIHSTRFILVDRSGRIRAFYDGLDPASKPLIIRDVERLLNEQPG